MQDQYSVCVCVCVFGCVWVCVCVCVCVSVCSSVSPHLLSYEQHLFLQVVILLCESPVLLQERLANLSGQLQISLFLGSNKRTSIRHISLSLSLSLFLSIYVSSLSPSSSLSP